MKRPVIIIGGGGHTKVLIDCLKQQSISILGFTDKLDGLASILGVDWLGNDEVIYRFSPEEIQLVNGIGSVKTTAPRRRIYDFFKGKGYKFEQVFHSSTILADDFSVNEGVQIMAGVVIQSGSKVGKNTIVNTRASIDHDCSIGSHVHIAPGTTICGGVQIEDGVHVGAGATIIQNVRIGKNSLVGAGALVLKDVPDGATVIGSPAREAQR